MPRYAYDRLSAQDNMFLVAETANTPMHIAAVQIVEAGDLATPDGGIDIARYKRALESALHLIPRYRQKLRQVGVQNRPVWVDDRHFSLDYHVRHSSLPRPGTLAQLKSLCSRIVSHPLDRSRPLWEIWLIEGVEGGEQFALVSKIHHCMLDGSAGSDLAQVLASPSPRAEIEDPLPYIPRPAPSAAELVRDEFVLRLGAPLRAARELGRFLSGSDDMLGEIRTRAGALRELASWSLNSSSDTPLNGQLGPHRRFDWLTMPLDDVKDVKEMLGCTVNDVVLATVAGAVRAYLQRRRVDPGALEFRISAPVNRRPDDQQGKMGNFVSSWIVPLPIGEADAQARLKAVRDATANLKESSAAVGVEMMMGAMEWMPDALVALGAQAAAGPVNMIVTNVPGPQFPLYQLGARILGTYPMVPTLPGGGLGVALFSYDGRLCWGFNADPSLVPDLPAFVDAIKAAFEELRSVAASKATEPKRRQKSRAAGELPRVETREAGSRAEEGTPLAAAGA